MGKVTAVGEAATAERDFGLRGLGRLFFKQFKCRAAGVF
jgi:hypothetical protein